MLKSKLRLETIQVKVKLKVFCEGSKGADGAKGEPDPFGFSNPAGGSSMS